jgi:membrane-bound ClpP family serine protease
LDHRPRRPYLAAAVGTTGTAVAALRRRYQRVHRRTVMTAALAAILVTVGWAAATTILNIHDDGYLAGLLGATAIMLGATTRDLRNCHRAELLLLGAGAIAVFLSFHTDPGTTMIWWFMD